MGIFSDEAPKYWALNLPAIPLRPKQKMPAINAWHLFADKLPSQDEKDVWLANYPESNIGLPMGPASGLIAIDIDTDDPKILAVLEKVLPPSPWHRVGKKGSVRVYKYNGQRTTRIKGSDGGMIVEILSKGTQFVLPPSIHPDTQMPYVANANLYDVIDQVVPLPMDIESRIRDALAEVGIDASVGNKLKVSVHVPAGARDNALTAHAGILARAVTRGERTLLDALGEIEHWVDNFVEKVVGDPVSVEKAQSKLIEFLVRDVTGERHVSLPIGWDEGLSDDDKEKLGLSFTKDDEIWNATKMLEYLAGEFSRFELNDSGWIAAVEVVLSQIAKAGGSLSVLDEDRVLRFIMAQSKTTLSVSTLKKQVSVLRKGDIVGENHDEIAKKVAEFIMQYGEIRYDATHFWQWRGSHWEQYEDMAILGVIQDNFGFYPACRRYNDYVAVMKSLAVNVRQPLKELGTIGLNFANGFLTETGELIGHDPDHGCTYTLPYRYMPEISGHMPMFMQYLMDSWGEDPDYMDKIAALQEAIGATLFGAAPQYQRAFCLIGQAGSGKSRIFGLLQGLVPRSAICAIPPSDWGDKYLPAQLFGKIINFAGELSETRNIPGESFKQIIEGAVIVGQHKNQQPFSFNPESAHWFGSNHNPKTKDSSEGFTRRWLFLEFNHKVPAHKKILDLDQRILEVETEAIVAWAVEGYARLRRHGEYTLPTSHMVRADQMAQDNNSVRYFLAETKRLVIGQTYTQLETTEAALHGEYWTFCIGTNTTPRVGMKQFHQMMKELQEPFDFKQKVGTTQVGNPETTYVGIAFRGKEGKSA